MATYEIPAEPTVDRVWLTYRETQRTVAVKRSINGTDWVIPIEGVMAYSWASLLSRGTVTDLNPDDVSWLPPGPWLAEEEVVVDTRGQQVLYVAADGLATQKSERKLAALIARLVNEYVARQAGAS